MSGHNGTPDTAAIGGVFVEIIFSTLVYGCTLAQTMYYLWNYPGDGMTLKILVGALWFLDTIRALLVVDNEWWYLVRNHANPASLEDLQGGATIPHCVVSVIVIYIVQCFFIHNIWKLLAQKDGRIVLTSIALAFATISAAAGFVFTYEATGLANESIFRILSGVIPSGSIQSVAALITDLYITVSLCVILRAAKTYTADGAQAVLSQLIIYTVNRGLLIIFVQFIQFITYVPQWHDVHMIVDMFHLHEPSCTVYVNALLAVLNVRQHLRERRQAISMLWERPAHLSVDSYLPESTSTETDVMSPASRPRSLGPVGILVTREVIVDGCELDIEHVEALANADGVSLCSDGIADMRLARSNTV
ncbi:hypothetical protein FOMPIDRAFT_1047933 [Fomitopsis schrenkii]|uniref:DUF6534 domain-containing protein n=1 Tax=Fomitopsis schrenkii TaxID=2126942 RepID=S8ECB4_FOMSC|nr:hypothetical protein FOMPIDRAFT_1047933 [Fomitopsis schrenkii]